MFSATPKNIANGVIQILDNPKKKAHILKGCAKTRELLGNKHCVEEVAKVIKIELIGE